MNAPDAPVRAGGRLAHLGSPFFGPAHRALAAHADAWARGTLGDWIHGPDADGVAEQADVRSPRLMREVLAYYGGLPDFAFALQGLGTRAIDPGTRGLDASQRIARELLQALPG